MKKWLPEIIGTTAYLVACAIAGYFLWGITHSIVFTFGPMFIVACFCFVLYIMITNPPSDPNFFNNW